MAVHPDRRGESLAKTFLAGLGYGILENYILKHTREVFWPSAD